MKSNNHIIKDILTKMFYDSRLTLNENKKRIISEECIPTDLKLDDFQQGKPRSIKYPELGNWGDGTCKCEGNCLEFKKKCCGKLTITSGDASLQQEKPDPEPPKPKIKIDIDGNGKQLILPINAFVTTRVDLPKVASVTLDEFANMFPLINDHCNFFGVKNRWENKRECLDEYLQFWKSSKVDNAVIGFEIDGLNYRNCYSVRSGQIFGWQGEDSKDYSSIKDPKDVKWHVGYGVEGFGDDCSEKYKPPTYDASNNSDNTSSVVTDKGENNQSSNSSSNMNKSSNGSSSNMNKSSNGSKGDGYGSSMGGKGKTEEGGPLELQLYMTGN